uniref:Putative secreted protein ovary overexpressed n=1 Tax=Rhipicephalus microplus TaxID=6941 RepID=A0A6M2DAL4_RHIMP
MKVAYVLLKLAIVCPVILALTFITLSSKVQPGMIACLRLCAFGLALSNQDFYTLRVIHLGFLYIYVDHYTNRSYIAFTLIKHL